MARRANDSRGGWGEGNVWSEPVPFREAVDRAPVFIRLEEGDRGDVEQLSFSAGDTMALEGDQVSRGRRLVLAHYTSEVEHEDIYGCGGAGAGDGGRGDSGLYCALMTLPYDRLPDIDVSILEDPHGHFYTNFLATNFPDCNWKEQQAELLESLDEHDYTNVSIITPKPKREPRRETWKLPKPLPPTPPSKPGHGDEAKAPVRPPKPPNLSASLPRDVVPPRPPPRQLSVPGDRLSMPTIGELFGSDDTYYLEPSPPLPEKDVSKEKKETFTYKIMGKVKKMYGTVGRQKSDTPSPKSPRKQLSLDTKGSDNINSVDDDTDSDPEGNYEMIDEKKMDAKYDRSPRTHQKEPDRGAKKGEKGESKPKKKAVATVRPAQRQGVEPTRTGVASLSDRPQMPHPMMNPTGVPVEVYELENEPPLKIVTSPLQEMTCDELCERLDKCGMSNLAEACKKKTVDGAFFVHISNDIFKKPPFSLSDFDLKKLDMVKAGWVPRM